MSLIIITNITVKPIDFNSPICGFYDCTLRSQAGPELHWHEPPDETGGTRNGWDHEMRRLRRRLDHRDFRVLCRLCLDSCWMCSENNARSACIFFWWHYRRQAKKKHTATQAVTGITQLLKLLQVLQFHGYEHVLLNCIGFVLSSSQAPGSLQLCARTAWST